MARKSPASATLRRLFALSGNECAFPGCNHVLVNRDGVYVAQLCHIEAAEVGGQRYNDKQTNDDRRAFENLLLMCYEHHKITDDIDVYTVEKLKEIKSSHEQRFAGNPYCISDDSLDQVLESIEQKLSYIIDQNNQTHDSLNNLSEGIDFIASSLNTIVVEKGSLYNDSLKIGLKLRKDNKLTAALDFFQVLEKENWENLPEEVRFKLLANIGVTLLDLGYKENATAYFLKINKLSYETPESLTYVCLAYAILNEEEKFDFYFDRTLSTGDGGKENLWLAYLLIKGRSNTVASILDKVPSKFLKSDFIAVKLLELYYKEGNQEQAKQIKWQIEESINAENYKEWQVTLTYVGLLMSTILTVEKLQFKQFNAEEISLIEKAILLYTKVINGIGDVNAPKVISTVYYNRGLCFMALSRKGEMELDFDTSWSLSNSFVVFKALLLTSMKAERFEACELLLKRWKVNKMNSEEEFETLICEARLRAVQGNFQQLEAVLNNGYDRMPAEYKPLILDNLVLNATYLKAYSSVLKYSKQLIVDFPQYVYGYIGLFIYYMKVQERFEALSALNQTKDKKYDERSEKFIWLQIADGFCELEEYQDALIYFDKLEKYKDVDLIKSRSAECHFNLKNYNHVIDLLKDVDLVESDFTSHQIMFWSYYNLQLMQESYQTLLLGLERKNAKEVDFFKKIGATYYSEHDQFDDARMMILSIGDFSNFEILEAFRMVDLMSTMGYIQEAFDLACRLRVIFYDTFEAHKYYVDFSLHHPNFPAKDLFLKFVEENTLVVIIDENNTEYKYYLRGDNRVSDGVSLETGDQLWNVLFKRKKGQVVEFPNTMGVFKIKEIWSKYLIAFRDSLFLLQNKYGDQSGMYFAKFSEKK